MSAHKRNSLLLFIFIIFVPLLITACAKRSTVARPHPFSVKSKTVSRIGYSIQAGSFSEVENAARLTESLRSLDLNATYLIARTGLYKVRFGNFPSRETARLRAEALKFEGVIEEFYIVRPEEYAVSKKQQYGDHYLRDEIVKTASSFVGIPYLWGGTSADMGFDCSGLAMAVYQINGLNLPRSSDEQYESGFPVESDNLQKGDLVFFSLSENGPINHVGIYVGEDRFIHAPGRGKKIRFDTLSQSYYRTYYRGSRSYL
jgi:hypothetical protein